MITDAQIEKLREAARAVGDADAVRVCSAALGEDVDPVAPSFDRAAARETCERWLTLRQYVARFDFGFQFKSLPTAEFYSPNGSASYVSHEARSYEMSREPRPIVDVTRAAVAAGLIKRERQFVGAMNLLSGRDHPLIWTHGKIVFANARTLTAELYVKWYELYLVTDGAAEIVCFGDLAPFVPAGKSAYVDPVPNPDAISAYAEAKGLVIDPVFYEVAVGRWALEVES